MERPLVAIFLLSIITLCFIIGLVEGDNEIILTSGISLLIIFVFVMCLDAQEQSNKNS